MVAAALARALFLIILRDSRRGLAAGVVVTGVAVLEGTGSRLITEIGATTLADVDMERGLASRVARVGVGSFDTGG